MRMGILVPAFLALMTAGASGQITAPQKESGTSGIDREVLARAVQEEVRKQMPALVQAEVKKQMDELVQQAGRNARANSAVSTLQTLRSMLELYKVQHNDRFPMMAELSGWKALRDKTTQHGAHGDIEIGGYLQNNPVNALTGSSTVVSAGAATAEAGWTWDEKKGILRVVVPEAEREIFRGFPEDNMEVVKGAAAAKAPMNAQSKLKLVASTLQIVRSQLELYQIQHADKPPSLEMMVTWKALLEHTDALGQAGPGKRYGPYLTEAPVNPLTGSSTLVAAGTATKDAGWTYDVRTGEIRPVVPGANTEEAAEVLGKGTFDVVK